ncbi:hypothetical protein KAR48_13280 [bacterium]|nr:hypothetical protein [bacterium]
MKIYNVVLNISFAFIALSLLATPSVFTQDIGTGDLATRNTSPPGIRKIKQSDEQLIRSAIHQFKLGIKRNDEILFSKMLTNDVKETSGRKSGKQQVKESFRANVSEFNFELRDTYSKRRSPQNNWLSAHWDFEIDISSIHIKNGNKHGKPSQAVVVCDLYFAKDQPDDDVRNKRFEKKPKKGKERLVLIKEHGRWKVSEYDQLFAFMEERKNKFIARDRKKH